MCLYVCYIHVVIIDLYIFPTCQLVGWRDVSRKLLLYITDAGFHYAGDGLVHDIM